MNPNPIETDTKNNRDRPIFYSKSDPGFYCVGIHGDAIPKDAVAITREEHRTLLNAQSKGKVIQADEKGYPIAVDRPPPTLEELKEIALNRRRARMATAIQASAPLQDAVDLDMATPDEERDLKAWKLYRVKLNRIEQQVGFPTQIDWPKAPDTA